MGISVGGGFEFFVAGRAHPTYRMRVDRLDEKCRKAFVSITYPDGRTRQHSVIARDIALHVFYRGEAPLDIQLQRIKMGNRGDLLADFNISDMGFYEWRKAQSTGLGAR